MASLRSRLQLAPNSVYLIDGSAFVHRAFHALQNMSRSDGFPTNILFVVTRLLLKILREEQPSHLAFILDGKGPNRRNDIYPEYKANRSKTPEALIQQLDPLLTIIEHLGIPSLVSQGFEADDYIASLAKRFSDAHHVVIVGTDKDLKQCLSKTVVMWDPASKDERITTLEDFREETGIAPSSWPDYQALIGDSSDNIPGIPQVGPKTALPLIQEFTTLENLFDRLAAVPPKVRNKLEGRRDDALIFRKLTSLHLDVCPEVTLEDLAMEKVALAPVVELFNHYELRALIREVQSMDRIGFWDRPPLDDENTDPQPLTSLNGSSEAGASGDNGVKADPPITPFSGVSPFPEALKPSGSSDASATTPETKAKTTPPSPSKAASPRQDSSTMVEGSLFSLAPQEASLDESLFTPCADLTPMHPMGQGEPVFIMPLEQGLLVAYAGKEYHVTPQSKTNEASHNTLITALAERLIKQQAVVVTPDSKILYKTYSALADLPASQWFDLSLATYLLSPEERNYSWDFIRGRYGLISGSAYANTGHHGLLGLDIYPLIKNQLLNTELDTVLGTIEAPLVPILTAMEERGITLDLDACASFLNEVQTSLDKLTETIYAMAEGPFNIRSSQQLGHVLFEFLQLPKAGKTKGGAMSTSQAALEKLRGKHPIIDAIEEYRTLEKLRSTYLEPLPQSADLKNRIHTTFNQTATATGRLSSSNPNLQNIPIRGQFGPRMRACFIATPGQTLVCADYSQVELRVLAHLSQDPTLVQAFLNNQDIHRSTAALLFDVQAEDISQDQRRDAKTINFGLIYGMGAQKLGQELGISMKEAKVFIERYFERLSKLKEFYDNIEKEAAEQGFVATMTGRRRLTPDITSSNNQLRSQARRQAINTRIQGSAADIIKLAMIAVENDPHLQSLGARLLLQIHDELVLETQPEVAEEAGKRLAQLMSEVTPGGQALSVPLLVDWGIGDNWSLAH